MEFYLHNINEDDIREIVKTLNTPFLTTGPVTKKFEHKLSEYLDAKCSVAVSSCTAALHLSLLALDIGPGDEVITTPMTFVSTVNSIVHTGAIPVFTDIDPETGNIDVTAIESKITSKTKAIIPVHLYGVLCDMKKIYQIARKFNLKIISDCAHAFESRRENYNSADYCDAACYSFYATKNLTCGEGGAVVTNDEQLAEKIRLLRLHGMSKTAADRYTGKYQHYDVEYCGWKYNMDDIHASLLVKQIDRIDSYRNSRAYIYNRYIEQIKQIDNIFVPTIPQNCVSAHHLFVIRVKKTEKRDYYINKLQENGVPVAVNFNPVHLMSYYKNKFGYNTGDFPESEEFGYSVITLPFYVKLTAGNMELICNTLKKVFAS